MLNQTGFVLLFKYLLDGTHSSCFFGSVQFGVLIGFTPNQLYGINGKNIKKTCYSYG